MFKEEGKIKRKEGVKCASWDMWKNIEYISIRACFPCYKNKNIYDIMSCMKTVRPKHVEIEAVCVHAPVCHHL